MKPVENNSLAGSLGDLDYFFATDGIVYLVRGERQPASGIMATPVFWPDADGNRQHPTRGRYRKQVADFCDEVFAVHPEYRRESVPRHLPLVPWADIGDAAHPREAFRRFLAEEDPDSVWRRVAAALTSVCGVPAGDIGIFGSRLVELNRGLDGQPVKDVDFVVYGFENYQAVRASFEDLLAHLGCGHISVDHLRYHADKFGRQFAPGANTFERTLANKWSSIQVAPGLLNTLRFAYRPGESPDYPVSSPAGKEVNLAGTVIDDDGANFFPRIFRLQRPDGAYTAVSWFWAHQACVRLGDRVEVTGNLHADGRFISLDSRHHGIRIV